MSLEAAFSARLGDDFLLNIPTRRKILRENTRLLHLTTAKSPVFGRTLSISEVIGLEVEDLAIGDDGTGRLTIRRSQTDPEGEDRVAILEESTLRRLGAWLQEAGIQTGPMFRHRGAASEHRMSERGIRLLVTRRAHAADIAGAALLPLAIGRRRPANHSEHATVVDAGEPPTR